MKHTDRAGEAVFIDEILVLPLIAALDRPRVPNILAIIFERTCERVSLEDPHRQELRKTNQYFCSAKRQGPVLPGGQLTIVHDVQINTSHR